MITFVNLKYSASMLILFLAKKVIFFMHNVKVLVNAIYLSNKIHTFVRQN